MSGTDPGYAATTSQRYAMPGTDIGYAIPAGTDTGYDTRSQRLGRGRGQTGVVPPRYRPTNLLCDVRYGHRLSYLLRHA
eukprot:3941943-Rhodomonas_salina.2